MTKEHLLPNKLFAALAILAILAMFSPLSASAASQVVWDQGFETDTNGWLDSDDAWYGDVARVPSGTDGIDSFSGDYHAIFEGSGGSAPFSRFDGYRAAWPGDYTAEVAVYLDTDWDAGEGFDYSVASNGSDNNHQRDFIFHVGMVEEYGPITGKALLVNGSNNADFTTNPYKLVNENGGSYYEVTESGWYILQHHFYDNGGQLAVDLNLLDDEGTVLWSATRTSALDTIPGEVGGNRYAWFTHIGVTDGIAVDSHALEVTLPDPASKQDCMLGDWEMYGFKNQGQCVRFIETGKDSR